MAKNILPKIKSITVWVFTKPIIRIAILTDEEKIFIHHANKFLQTSAIRPEHRKEGGKDGTD